MNVMVLHTLTWVYVHVYACRINSFKLAISPKRSVCLMQGTRPEPWEAKSSST